MEKAKRIDITITEYINDEWNRATIKGIYYNGEYDVDIYYKRHGNVWYICESDHITCKRVNTINKRLEKKGFKKGL